MFGFVILTLISSSFARECGENDVLRLHSVGASACKQILDPRHLKDSCQCLITVSEDDAKTFTCIAHENETAYGIWKDCRALPTELATSSKKSSDEFRFNLLVAGVVLLALNLIYVCWTDSLRVLTQYPTTQNTTDLNPKRKYHYGVPHCHYSTHHTHCYTGGPYLEEEELLEATDKTNHEKYVALKDININDVEMLDRKVVKI